ncbi:PDZ domain-containing protein [Streptomyces sp. NPDC058751]|uniref:PDZ domain-containing protein n=1 Tax=Streptomyces sp. NPDC058751 TaxID=3346623 RepID=UPI0036C7F73A
MEQTALRPKPMPGRDPGGGSRPPDGPRPPGGDRRPRPARRRGRRLLTVSAVLSAGAVLVLSGVGLGAVGASVIGTSVIGAGGPAYPRGQADMDGRSRQPSAVSEAPGPGGSREPAGGARDGGAEARRTGGSGAPRADGSDAPRAATATAEPGDGPVPPGEAGRQSVRGTLGVEAVDAPGGGGALIVGVHLPGPGYTAGLVRGDVLLALDGTGITSAAGLARAVADATPGREVTLRVRHVDGGRAHLSAVPGTAT